MMKLYLVRTQPSHFYERNYLADISAATRALFSGGGGGGAKFLSEGRLQYLPLFSSIFALGLGGGRNLCLGGAVPLPPPPVIAAVADMPTH